MITATAPTTAPIMIGNTLGAEEGVIAVVVGAVEDDIDDDGSNNKTMKIYLKGIISTFKLMTRLTVSC